MALKSSEIKQYQDPSARGCQNTSRVVLRPLNPIADALEALGGLSRTMFYRMVKHGDVKLIKVGRRSFVSAGEIERLVAQLEAAA